MPIDNIVKQKISYFYDFLYFFPKMNNSAVISSHFLSCCSVAVFRRSADAQRIQTEAAEKQPQKKTAHARRMNRL